VKKVRCPAAWIAAFWEGLPLDVPQDHETPRATPIPATLFLLLAGAVAACQAIYINRPLPTLLGIVPDDLFYYLQIARHLARNGMPSFDGLTHANGFHPAWMLIATGLAPLCPTPLAFLRAVLWVAFSCHLGSALAIRLALGEVFSPATAWAGAAGWLMFCTPLELASQGLESAFYTLALGLALWAGLRLLRAALTGALRPGLPALTGFGLALVLCFWARTEAVVLAGVGCLLPVGIHLARPAIISRRQAITASAWLGALFALGTAPWFAWSYLYTGRLTQASGFVKHLWAATAPSVGAVARTVDALRYVGREWFGPWAATYLVNAAKVTAAIALGVLFLAWGSLARMARRDPRFLAFVAWLLPSALLTGLVYGFYFADRQVWYAAQPSFVVFVSAWAAGAGALAGLGSAFRRGVAWAALALLFLALPKFSLSLRTLYPYQAVVLRSQALFETLTPVGSRIGCFNAGTPAFFGHRTVVNLDGLVNNELLAYVQRRALGQFLRDYDIRYIADSRLPLRRMLSLGGGEEVPLEVVKCVPLPTGGEDRERCLWKVGLAPATGS
jgi:hypothetical protein